MWRDSALRITVAGLEAWALLPLLLWAGHMRWWTFYVAIGGVAVFGLLQYLGLTLFGALRRIRSWFAGSRRPGVPHHKQRHFV
jgi:intracellular multiplication protein IcmT